LSYSVGEKLDYIDKDCFTERKEPYRPLPQCIEPFVDYRKTARSRSGETARRSVLFRNVDKHIKVTRNCSVVKSCHKNGRT